MKRIDEGMTQQVAGKNEENIFFLLPTQQSKFLHSPSAQNGIPLKKKYKNKFFLYNIHIYILG
jgi:hypothetical protein